MTVDPIPLHPAQSIVFFERRELNRLMGLYGRMVAAGEWRDYAMSSGRDCAQFFVFRRSAEAPLYRIEKRPQLARKQGAWAVFSSAGQVLKRGHDLDPVLRVFDKGRLSIIE